jgi:hypothetical protein
VLTAKFIKCFPLESKDATETMTQSATAQAAPPTSPSSAASAGIDPVTVALIAAAVTAFTGQACRIISIKPMSSSWERAGRHSVLTSHRIR